MNQKLESKTCRTCKVNKPVTEYYFRITNSDGLCSNCKDCCREKEAQKRNRKPDTQSEYFTHDKNWY